MLRRVLVWTCLLTVWCGGSLAIAQQAELLSSAPAEAAAVLVVRDLADVSARIEGLAGKLSTPLPSPLLMVKAQLGLSEGVADQGSLGVVFMFGPRNGAQFPDVQPVVLIPVSDYGKALGLLKPADSDAKVTEVTVGGRPMVAGRRGNHLAVSAPEHRDALEQVIGATENKSAGLSPFADWIAENQVTLVLTPSGTKTLAEAALQGLEQVKSQNIPGQSPEMMKAGIGMYQDLVRGMQAEFTQAAVGLNIDADRGVDIEKRLLLRPEGELSKVAQSIGARTADPLAGLPTGQYMFAVGGPMLPGLADDMMQLSFNMMRQMPATDPSNRLTDEEFKQLAAIGADSMAGVQSMAMVMGVGKPGDPMYAQTVGTFKVEQSEKYLANYKNTVEKMQQLLSKVKVPYMGRYEVSPVQVGGENALKLTMDMSQADIPQTPGVPDPKMALESLIGPDGKINVYLAAADPQTVVMAYVSPENLQRGLQAARSGQPELAGDGQTGRTARLLPTSAPWVGYFSLTGTIEFARQMVSKLAPPVSLAMPAFPDSPPIGMSLQLGQGRLDSHVVIPTETMLAAVEFGSKVRALALPQNPQQPPAQPAR